MTNNTYNGWTNYATWNIPLWADNDYGLYQSKCDLLKGLDGPVTPIFVRDFVDNYMNGSTPDIRGNDWEGGRIQDVNWSEIAENWEIERQEILEYDS